MSSLSFLNRHLHFAQRLCQNRLSLINTISSSYSIATIQNTSLLEKIDATESWSKISNKMNDQLTQNTIGRLFAVVMAAGKQRKVTNEDVIILDKPIEAQIGEKIRLNKVLLVGSSDFTLIGRPLLKPDVVQVEATVIEKSLSHPLVLSWYRRRENFRFFKLRKIHYTHLRINDIKLLKVPS